MGKPWFRMYHEMIDDPKITPLTDAQFRLWTEILCLACRVGNCGNTNLTPKQLVHQLRKNSVKTLNQLLTTDLIHLAGEDPKLQTVVVTKWKERQFESDSSTPRVNAYRDRQKEAAKNTF